MLELHGTTAPRRTWRRRSWSSFSRNSSWTTGMGGRLLLHSIARAVVSNEIQSLIHVKPTVLLLWSTDAVGRIMDGQGRFHLELLRSCAVTPPPSDIYTLCGHLNATAIASSLACGDRTCSQPHERVRKRLVAHGEARGVRKWAVLSQVSRPPMIIEFCTRVRLCSSYIHPVLNSYADPPVHQNASVLKMAHSRPLLSLPSPSP
jgi:hypothetical protein